MAGTVLTVASGKGGVGKTTTAVNLAVALWTDGNAVAVVDADLGMANLGAVLGLEPGSTLHDVLAGSADLEEALVEAKDGDLLVLPGDRNLTGFADADPGELRTVLGALAERCDYVVVDTGAGLSYEDVLPLGLADEVLLVTTPDPAAVGDTRKTFELSGLLEGRVRGVVVTRALEDTDAEAVAAEIGVELLGVIPEDPAVTKSTTTGDPLASHAPDAQATAAYAALAKAVAGEDETRGAAAVEADDSGLPVAESDDGDEKSVAAAEEEPALDADDEPDAASVDPPEEAVAAGSGADEGEESAVPGEEPEDATEQGDDDPSAAADEEPVTEGDTSDAEEPVDDDDEPTDDDEVSGGDDEPERRGGLTGWLGRLFS